MRKIILLLFLISLFTIGLEKTPRKSKGSHTQISQGKIIPRGKIMQTISDYNKLNEPLNKKIGLL